jgi:hypothetical protein
MGAWPARGEPHSPQNFTVGGFGLPHAAQARAIGDPHSPQNLRPGSFSLPQAVQRTEVLSALLLQVRVSQGSAHSTGVSWNRHFDRLAPLVGDGFLSATSGLIARMDQLHAWREGVVAGGNLRRLGLDGLESVALDAYLSAVVRDNRLKREVAFEGLMARFSMS